MTDNITDHIVKSFNKDMEELSSELLRMGRLVHEQIVSAIAALEKRDARFAGQVRKNDKQVDAINDDIEERVMSILALRHPFAVDLRETIAALKIARELERIGDLSKNIAKRTAIIVDLEPVNVMNEIAEMGRLAAKIVKDVTHAYETRSVDQAIEVWNADNEIDQCCNDIFYKVLSGMMSDNSNINACTQLIFVVKNLERIGDHATNVAESIYFVLTGEKIDQRRPKSDKTSSTIVKSRDE